MLVDKNYYIILYYHYVRIKEPEYLRKEQFDECRKLNLMGRIIVSSEGINGTLSGLCKNIELYMINLKKNKYFKNINFKIVEHNENVFSKLSVKHRKEIVSLKLNKDIFPKNREEFYLNPQEFYDIISKNNNDTFLLDVRNNYEYDLGHFKNSINPNINHFRELPNWIEKEISNFKDKKVIIYCTGGVRCEKISTFLKEKGIWEVYQLKGGIINYSQDKKVNGKLFEGKMYVFDQRISMNVNFDEKKIIGKDYFDQKPCERYINCANPECNKQILCSEKNEYNYLGSCSDNCRNNKKNRYFKKKLIKQKNFQ
ncbi:oxygen-dependent tRNA uridine(34) hydroxylase TrhO [Candidatus Phytoplasma sacchari]|uniref:tRNA uridine(34) hydroxylase n=1 Tax=Candidatus Phytoplasma sacchari TaxID=2609813 RepID=A0ABY7M233_9MOLU|nr:rhodanese-related sulfurtransferase [Candidatus Phytoplasma sacchari]